ncbi:MAG: ABC transporter substrate-binding protein [Mycobacteriales bacterium]
MTRLPRLARAPLALAAGLLLATSVAACSGASANSGSGKDSTAPTLRLGYFANVTHATPVVGVGKGFYPKRLGKTQLKTQIFNAGPAAVEAMLSGSLDAAYLGPNPAINAWAKTHNVRIIAGATTGGASLVVKPNIGSAADLKGRRLADPQLGGTQDVALRNWLAGKGLKPDSDVKLAAGTDNATTLQLFQQGQIDGAWVPEPWASRLVLDGGGKVLVDERTLWPGGKFVTTHLLVNTSFLNKYPKTVKALLQGQVDTNDWIAAHPADAKATVNAQLKQLTGKSLTAAALDRAWGNITITNDPDAQSLNVSAKHAEKAKLLDHVDLKGIYDLRPLNDVLGAAGKPKVKAAGLGKE